MCTECRTEQDGVVYHLDHAERGIKLHEREFQVEGNVPCGVTRANHNLALVRSMHLRRPLVYANLVVDIGFELFTRVSCPLPLRSA